MPDNSFDVVSVVDMPEVLNAVQQAKKEFQTRFDLKDSKSEIELNEKDKKLIVTSIDDFKLRAVVEITRPEFPVLLAIFESLDQSLFLLVARDVQKELQDYHRVRGQHLLEVVDLTVTR